MRRNLKIFVMLIIFSFFVFGFMTYFFSQSKTTIFQDSEIRLEASSNDKLIISVNEKLANYNTSNDQGNPSLCVLSNDTFVVAWTTMGQDGSYNGVYASVFDATTGTNTTAEFRVNDQTLNDQDNPSLCALSSNTFVAAWTSFFQDGSYDGVYARVFNATTGTSITAEFRVNHHVSDDQENPSLCALSSNTFIAAWTSLFQDGSSNGVYARVFNATTGTNITAEFRVNYQTLNDQKNPSLCALSNNTFAVAWTSMGQDGSYNGVYARVFDATTGTNTTAEFQINQITLYHQEDPSICSLSSGEFVVVWKGMEDYTEKGVYARLFNATTGKNITKEFKINNYTINTIDGPSVSSLSRDIFVVSWANYDQDGDAFDVYANVFNATTGNNISTEFRVNNFTTGDQSKPSIESLSNERFVITWESIDQDLLTKNVYFSIFGFDYTPPNVIKDGMWFYFSELRAISFGATIIDSLSNINMVKVIINATVPFSIEMEYTSNNNWEFIWRNASLYPNGFYRLTIWAMDEKGNINQQEFIDIVLNIEPIENDNNEMDIIIIIGIVITISSVAISSVLIYNSKKKAKHRIKITKKIHTNIIKKAKLKKTSKNITQGLKSSIKSSKEIFKELSNKEKLLEMLEEGVKASDHGLTLISDNLLSNIDKISFNEIQKKEFLREMFAFPPLERADIVTGILEGATFGVVVPAIPKKEKKVELEHILVYEEKTLELIQTYIEKHKRFEINEIIPFLVSRFTRASININIIGIKEIIKSLIEKNLIVEGSILVKNEILNNNNRRMIFEHIQDKPGIHLNKLAKKLYMSSAVIRWHVEILEKFNCIRKEIIGNHYAFFDLAKNPANDQLLHFISREKIKKIIQYIELNNEGCLLTKISKELGMHYNTVKNYIQKLEDFDLVFHKKERIYYINKKNLNKIAQRIESL